MGKISSKITKGIAALSTTFMLNIPATTTAQETAQTVTEFQYTGNVQTWTAPKTGTYKLETWGAAGGSLSSGYGGQGGYASGEITLRAGEMLYVYVGGKGQDAQGSIDGNCGSVYVGGWNGGGNGGGSAGPGGGGGTDIRKDNADVNNRVIVAGGGGGGYEPYSGANDGGNEANLYTIYDWQDGSTGYYGGYCKDTAGGGGGYYGGQSIDGDDPRSAYGGSSYTGNLSNALKETGVRYGDGFAKITLLTQQVDLVGITVSQRSVSLPLGSGTQLSIIANYNDGSTKDITSQAIYKSSNTNVLSVNTTGYIATVGRGSADVTVTYREKITPGVMRAVSARVKATSY